LELHDTPSAPTPSKNPKLYQFTVLIRVNDESAVNRQTTILDVIVVNLITTMMVAKNNHLRLSGINHGLQQ
jgi:hypothetical protein